MRALLLRISYWLQVSLLVVTFPIWMTPLLCAKSIELLFGLFDRLIERFVELRTSARFSFARFKVQGFRHNKQEEKK